MVESQLESGNIREESRRGGEERRDKKRREQMEGVRSRIGELHRRLRGDRRVLASCSRYRHFSGRIRSLLCYVHVMLVSSNSNMEPRAVEF